VDTFATIAFGGVIYAIPVVYGWMQWRAARSWRGGWRGLALVPLGFAGFLTFVSVMGLIQGSNLWPLPLIFGLPLCMGCLGVLAGLRRFTGAT